MNEALSINPVNDPLNEPVKLALAEVNEPVIETYPVNSCVLVNKLPNLVDPVTYSVDEVIT